MNIAIIYPNQLFETKYLPYDVRIIDCFILVEDSLFFSDTKRKLKFNMLKLIYQRASMKYYESYLKEHRLKVFYLNWTGKADLVFDFIVKKFGSENTLHIIDPTDHLLSKRILKYSKSQSVTIYENPSFLLTKSDLQSYVEYASKMNRKIFYQYNFYIWHRKRSEILIDSHGKPVGGKYSFDKYNRQPIRSDRIENTIKAVKSTIKKYHGKFYESAIKYCERTFKNYYPENYEPNNIFYYPITHSDSKAHYKQFLKHKIQYFGLYQDAMIFSSTEADLFASMTLFHSVCSIQLNNGLLVPSDIERLILDYYHTHKKKKDILHPIEGFIRQLNWREYVRFIYLYSYDDIIRKNYFRNRRHLTLDWYKGTTGIEPVDQAIRFAFRFGYLHHIIRLMVVCNFMNLCQIHPTDVYKWFMEFSLDSYDWVMLANVYSMGMYADGGLATTKPYISSSNYILRMGHIREGGSGNWETAWKILYYFFIYRNGSKLKGRGQMYLSHWSKQSNKKLIIENAVQLIKSLTKK